MVATDNCSQAVVVVMGSGTRTPFPCLYVSILSNWFTHLISLTLVTVPSVACHLNLICYYQLPNLH